MGLLGLPRLFALDVFALWTWRFVLPFVLLAAGALVLLPKLRERIGLGPGRRLHRSVSNRVLAGVAGGIAEEWDVDANLVRVALLLLVVVTGGLGLVLYVLAIVVMHEEEVPIPPVARDDDLLESRRRFFGCAGVRLLGVLRTRAQRYEPDAARERQAAHSRASSRRLAQGVCEA